MASLSDFDRVGTFGQGKFSTVGCYRHIFPRPGNICDEIGGLVAIKSYNGARNSPRVARIQQELNVLSILNSKKRSIHTNKMLRCIWNGIDNNDLHIVLEPALGGALNKHIVRGNLARLQPEVAKGYAAEVASALFVIHSLWCLHRDIKANNIILDHYGHAIICDFGSAKCLPIDNEHDASFDVLGNVIISKKEQGPYRSRMTYEDCPRTFTIIGAPHAMAPEVCAGVDGPGHTFAADWWSFGVLLYEMLIGHPPLWKNREINDNTILGEDWDWDITDVIDSISDDASIIEREGLNLVVLLLSKDPTERWNATSTILKHDFFVGIDWNAIEAGTFRPPNSSFDRRLGFIDLLEADDLTDTPSRDGSEVGLSAEQQALFEGY